MSLQRIHRVRSGFILGETQPVQCHFGAPPSFTTKPLFLPVRLFLGCCVSPPDNWFGASADLLVGLPNSESLLPPKCLYTQNSL